PLLFITVLNTIAKDLIRESPSSWTIIYADDAVLNDTSRKRLEERTQAWSNQLHRLGLKLNLNKTVYVEFGTQTPGTISIEGVELSKPMKVRYLGATLSADGDTASDVTARTTTAWQK